jgi:DNA-binding ferritin-like protein (Dps family)
MPQFLNGDKKDEFLKYLRPILQYIKDLFNIDLSEETIGKDYKKKAANKITSIIETYKLTNIVFMIDDQTLLIDSIINMKKLLGLGDNIDGFTPEFIDNKKNEFEAKFKEAVKKMNDECAQENNRNCRKPGVDENMLLERALFQ